LLTTVYLQLGADAVYGLKRLPSKHEVMGSSPDKGYNCSRASSE